MRENVFNYWKLFSILYLFLSNYVNIFSNKSVNTINNELDEKIKYEQIILNEAKSIHKEQYLDTLSSKRKLIGIICDKLRKSITTENTPTNNMENEDKIRILMN
jgi:hypothetical protein